MLVIREWKKLSYYNPEKILKSLRQVELTYPVYELPYKEASLRTRALRSYGESRQCALFCYGISQALNVDVRYAILEKSDYDFVGYFVKDDVEHFIPIQMKEFVPSEVNPAAELENEIEKLSKYVTSEGLCVAVYINRNIRIDFSQLKFSVPNIKELWFFGAKSEDQKYWWLVGNILEEPKIYEFIYPESAV
jgi:hypothetical protein